MSDTSICECGASLKTCEVSCEYCIAYKKKEQKREKTIFKKAIKISLRDYHGPVFFNGYWGTLREFCDHIDTMPKYVWACTCFGLELDARDIISNQLEQQSHHDGAFDHVVDIDELQNFFDDWLKKQIIESRVVDYSRAILLDGFTAETGCK